DMHEEPSRSVVQKQDSSLLVGIRSLIKGKTKAFVSAGNSGAALVAATLLLGRVEGIFRPALGAFLPHLTGTLFCLDLGANTDCKAAFLEQFALMGHCYVQLITGIHCPRVALLSNGHEPYKGSREVKEAYASLEKSFLKFVGN